MTEDQENAVALKLPTFWPKQPKVWFVQAEAQFNIRKITSDDTKFHYVVAALDQTTAKRIIDLLCAPPANDKYKALKNRLSDTYGLSEYERSARLLHMPELGDDKPSVLMDSMLALLDGHEPCFLFRGLFLERLPEEIRCILAHSGVRDCRQLSRAADNLWETRQPTASAIQWPARTSDKKPGNPSFCRFHNKFGDKAYTCRPPCSFKSSENGQNGRQ